MNTYLLDSDPSFFDTRLGVIVIALAIECIFFVIYYFAWSRPNPLFVQQPFWDQQKVYAGLIFIGITAIYALFSSSWNANLVYWGVASLTTIWFSEVMLLEIPREQMHLLPSSETVYLWGWGSLSIWGVVLFGYALFG